MFFNEPPRDTTPQKETKKKYCKKNKWKNKHRSGSTWHQKEFPFVGQSPTYIEWILENETGTELQREKL